MPPEYSLLLATCYSLLLATCYYLLLATCYYSLLPTSYFLLLTTCYLLLTATCYLLLLPTCYSLLLTTCYSLLLATYYYPLTTLLLTARCSPCPLTQIDLRCRPAEQECQRDTKKAGPLGRAAGNRGYEQRVDKAAVLCDCYAITM